VHALVGFAAGGNTDVVARAIAKKVGELLGQPVVIENRPGAGGVLATEAAASAPPDGYTLLVTNLSSHILAPAATARRRLDADAAFVPLALTNRTPIYLAASASVRADTLREFIAKARVRPGAFSYGAPSAGGVGHLAAVMFNKLAGITAEPIVYKGSNPATVDLAAGSLQYMFDGMAALGPHIASGRVTVLAVSGQQRQPELPNVPTFAEAGFAEMSQLQTWNAWLAPKATPAAIVQRLNQALLQALADAQLQQSLRVYGNEAYPPMTPAQVAAFIATERRRWLALLQQTGVKPE
jgi:tripartite-type tricarboxylate transporter receptor subunit TctC